MDLHRSNDSKSNKRANNCRSARVRYKKKNPDRYIFLVRCFETYSNIKGHLVSIVFQKDENNIYPLKADAKISCSCPAWIYWGSAYQSTTQDYWLDDKEFRYPIVRDPRLEHKICKHVARVRLDLRNLTFNMLDKSKRIIQAAELLDEVPIEMCKDAILEFCNRNNITDSLKFFGSLNEDNFEEQLLKIGMIQ